MQKNKIYILGAGSVAKDVISILNDQGKIDNIKGVIIEKKYKKKRNESINGIKIFDDSILEKIEKNSFFVCAIGLPTRKAFIKKVEKMGFNFCNVIHPTAVIGEDVVIGDGAIIYPNVCILRNINIGRHVIINIGSSISHNSNIADYTTISPGVDIGGYVTIGSGTWIGIGATIINKISIGKGVVAAAGTMINKNIPNGVLVVGIPAKPIRNWNNDDWGKLV